MQNEIRGIHIRILSQVRESPSCGEDLSRNLNKSYQYIHKVVKEMKTMKLIFLNEDFKDRRRKLISISPQGVFELTKKNHEEKRNQLEQEVMQKVEPAMKSFFEKLDEKIRMDLKKMFGGEI